MTFFVKQLALCAALVFGTLNPTSYSLVSWLERRPDAPASIIFLIASIVCWAFLIYIRGTLGALKWRGVIFLTVVCALAVWVLSDFDLLATQRPDAGYWITLTVVVIVLSAGYSWPHLRRSVVRSGRSAKRNQEWLSGL